MAFAKQYFSSYKSNNNLDYYLEIWVDGYTGGNPTEIKLGAGGPVISYDTDQEDRFSPILSSQCDLPFMVTGVGTEFFIRQLREIYKEKQVYLHLYRATSSTYTTTKPLWSGFLVMDLGSGEDVSFPYEQKLKFVDGLSLLKDLDFVDLSRTDTPPGDTIPLNERTQGNYSKFNMYYGPALYTFWIKEILKKVGAATSGIGGQGVTLNYGFTTAVNWYNGKMQNTNQNSDPLGLTKCVVTMFHEKNDQEVFTPENCYVVLKELLRHWGARITYWKHEFWIVQVPEYITNESGTLDNPDNINSRQYDLSGSLISSQDHLGDTYYTRYEQTIQTDKVSKIVGTQYNYLPMINNVDAQFLSFASNNYYGGFPYGNNAENQEIYQGTIVDPSTADFLFLSIPLDWVWDMGSSALVNGHTNGWHCQVRFNFFASQLLNGTVTTFYLQYNSSNGSYYWITEANWRPLGTESPNYKIKSRQLVESNYVGFEEQIPFVDDSGNAISMLGDWDFFLDIQKYGTTGSNPGSFICNFLGYGYQIRQFKPQTTIGSIPNPSGSGSTTSGTVSWSNTLEIPGTTNFSILPFSQLGFNAGTSTLDIRLITSSPFRGVLQALNTTAAATYGISLNTQIDNNTNTERYSFGTLLWGDAVQSFAIGALRVNTGTAFDKTDADGEWGRGILTGDKTFTELLIHEFLTGQLEVVISPSMRLVVGDSNKDVTISGVTRPRFVNPIGILRETRNGPDPVYFFRRGSFYSLYDEWDYEGYQILRDSVTSTTTTNDIGDLGGSQDSNPVSAAKMIGNVTDALSTNSTIASLRQTIASTGANVAVNGNFNVATGWTLGTGWSIDTTAQKAKFAATGSLSSLSQINLTEGTKYQVIFTIDITAGQLTVKAGTSGGSQVITVAGQYELYLLCEGSTSIVFQAGTTFTGSISQVSIADQKSLSSVPIESLGEAVFKTNDTFNLVNSINGEVIPLTVTSNQGATDTAISVTAVPLFDDIGIDSVLLINQDDLSAQYQNKTKGTVAGFDITATGIEKSSINITDWLNSDTMTGAAITNVPTALSVKNYVDGQVGASDTLQEVTDNGNTTTNSIMIGSSSSPAYPLQITNSSKTIGFGDWSGSMATYGFGIITSDNNLRLPSSVYLSNSSMKLSMVSNNAEFYAYANHIFKTNTGSERMRITSGGNVLIGTTSDGGSKLQVTSNLNQQHLYIQGGYAEGIGALAQIKTTANGNALLVESATTSDSREIFEVKNSNGTVFKVQGNGDSTFIGQVTIPATPVASTDAASKGYVDAQVGSADTLQEVTDNGASTTNNITIGGAYNTLYKNDGFTFTDNQDYNIISGSTKILDLHFNEQKFYIGGSEKMRLNSTGLGIGTSSPSAKLDIHGIANNNVLMLRDGSDDSVIQNTYIDSAGNGVLQLYANSQVLKNVINTNGNSYFNGGNVGIGLANPQRELHIHASNFTDLQLTNDTTGSGAGDGSTISATYSDLYINNKESANILLYTANTERARITSGGSLLIGGTTDNAKLTIRADSGYAFRTENVSGNTFRIDATNGNIQSSGNATFSGQVQGGDLKTTTGNIISTGNLIFSTSGGSNIELYSNGEAYYDASTHIFRDSDASPEYMRLTSDGKLGIGNTSPQGLLHITKSNATATFEIQGGLTSITASDQIHGEINFGVNDGSATGGIAGSIKSITENSNGAHNGLAFYTGQQSRTPYLQRAMQIRNTGGISFGSIGNAHGNSGQILKSNGDASPAWVDASSVIGGPYLPLTGGTLTGSLTGTTATFSGNSTFNSNFTVGGVLYIDNIQTRSGVNIDFRHQDGTVKMQLKTGTGNLLIGSTSDNGQQLQVTGSIYTTGVLKIDSANPGILFKETDVTDKNWDIQVNGGDLRFYEVNDARSVFTQQVTFKNGGNVLIGSTSDNGAKLQVTGGGTFSGDVTLDKSSGSSPSLNFINGSDDNGAILINSSGKIQIKTGGTVRQTISSGDTEFNGNIKLVNGSGNVTFASSSSDDLTVTSTTANFSGNLLLKTTTDVGVPLYVNGIIRTTGGSVQAGQDYGFTLQDESNNNRYGLKFGAAGSVGGSNLLMLTNRSLSDATGGGEVAIGANASTTGVTETEVVRIKAVTQSEVSIDGILSLTVQDTPADPSNNKSSIWLDSNWDLKIKITNSSGDTVTKTIVEYA